MEAVTFNSLRRGCLLLKLACALSGIMADYTAFNNLQWSPWNFAQFEPASYLQKRQAEPLRFGDISSIQNQFQYQAGVPELHPQKRQAFPPQPLRRPFLFPNNFVPAAVDNQVRARRESPPLMPYHFLAPIQSQYIFPQADAPRFRRSPLDQRKNYGKKFPAQLGKSCCLNADYCVPWACPPPKFTWKKLQPKQAQPVAKPEAGYEAGESRSESQASQGDGSVASSYSYSESYTGCVCNDKQFCPPGCTYNPRAYDRTNIGTRTKVYQHLVSENRSR